MKILTTKSIENMKAGLGEVPDGRVPGLSVLSGKRGPVSFGFRYRRPGSGRTAKITLSKINLGQPLEDAGRGDPLTLAQARAMAMDIQQQINAGIDPGRAVDNRRDTFGEVTERYFQERASGNRSARHARQIIEKDCQDWWARPIRSITTRDVRDLFKRASKRSRTAGNNLKAQLSPIFNWAIAEEILDENVIARVPNPAKVASRVRYLTNDELARVWSAACPMGKILILTGARLGEVEKIAPDQLDLDDVRPTWVIPASAAKNGKEHIVALCPAAVFILREVDHFPNANRSRWRKAWRERSGVDNWSPHDLRRTMASGMAEMDVDHHLIERCLNHQPKSMTAVALVYNRHGYKEKMRAAWMRWADRVAEIVEGKKSNVIKIY